MSLQGDLGSSFDCNPQDNRGREMKNNNENALTGPRVSSDPNANAIRTEDVGVTGNAITLPPLVSQNEQQDKLVAWVMDSPSEDPDLEEFELLECQELGEDDERCEAGESGEAQSDPPLDRQSGSCSSAPEEAKGDGRDEGGRGRASRQRGEDLVSTRVGQQTGQQPLSEGDVFLSCLSTMSGLGGSLSSTLDGVGGTLATDSQDVLSEAYRTASEDLTLASQSIPTTSVESRSLREVDREAAASGRSTAHSNSVDLNMNSSALTQEVTPEAQEDGEVQGPRRCPSLGGSSLLANGTSACQQNRTRKEQHGQWQKAFREAEGEQSWAEEHMPGSSSPSDLKCNKRVPARPFRPETGYDAIKIQSLRQRSQSPETPVYKTARKMNGLLSRDEEAAQRDGSQCSPSVGSGVTSGTGAVLRKQDSTEHERNTSPSSLERRAQSARRRCGSPTQVATSPSPRGMGSPKRKPPTSPAKVPGSRVSQQDTVQQGLASGLRAPSKVSVTSGIPKPILQHTPRTGEKDEPQSKSERSPPPKELPKPKTVRPKIITYVRKSPQVKPHVIEPPYEVSTLPSRLSTYTDPPAPKGPRAAVDPRASPVLSASNLLYDKYRHEMQKARFFSPSLVVSGIRPPSHTTPHKLTGKSDTFYGVLTNKFMPELGRVVGGLGGPAGEERSGTQLGPQEAGAVFRSPRALRPQLGLGAVARFPSTKNRMLSAGQRSALASSHPARDVSPVSHCYQDPADQGKSAPVITPKSFQPKHGQSGLRPPGYSRLPPARLAAFGFVRSASVSSVSSNQSAESTHSDPCRPAHHVQMFLPPPNQMPLLSLMASSSRLAKGSINKPQPERLHTKKERSKAHEGPSSGSDDPPLHRVTTPLSEVPRAPSQSGPQPPSTPVPTRRSLLPPPRSSPVASRKEIQKDVEVARPAVSSPKRFAVVPPRPQSPVHMRQKPGPGPGVAGRSASSGGSPKTEARAERDAECLLVRRLRAQCEEQARQLAGLQAELRKATLGLEVFAVSTQHFCQKSDRAIEREKELSLELAKIRDEVAFNAARWERLLHEKEALEQSFQQELRELQAQQEAELGALEEGLRARHAAETDYLRARHLAEQEGLQMRQREQIEDMTVSHETAMEEMENDHNMALAVLQDEHAAILRELRTTHEQQKNALEENFERLRLSLQDQVDTLTFQNRTLRDRAKRFEEALRRSTDEQILDALAPYQHIEEDLKSLKEVLEMKNQQIHQQEKKISELEKMAQKNVLLEEQVQVLQQQNEDLKARIDRNLALSRQLSEENANLQEHVEKESNEKKRLSRNNEELLWRLQTGELSPRMSPSSSPVHRASPGPASPSRLQSYPR